MTYVVGQLIGIATLVEGDWYFKDLKSNKKQEVVVEEIKESKKPYPLRCLVQFSKSFKKSRVNREMKNKEVKYWVNYKAIKVC